MSIVVRDLEALPVKRPYHIENLFRRLLKLDWQDAKALGDRVSVRPRDGETACAGRCEAFFGYVIGQGPNSDEYRINDKYGPTRYVAPWEIFTHKVVEEQHYDRTLKTIIREAERLLLDMLPENDRPLGQGLLQCNLNLYTANSTNMPHRDDIDERAATFHPASVTCILSVHAINPHFELYAPAEGPDGKPAERSVVEGRDAPDSVGEGVGRLFGLCGYDYLLGKHKARTGWTTETPNAFERMSLNFRFVREDAWSAIRRASQKSAAAA